LKGTALQEVKKLTPAKIRESFVSGHDFSRAEEGGEDEGF
jgi:hypothetical protein